MNNLLALAREFGISVAELTETPEKTDTDEADSVPPLPIQAPAKGRSTWKKVLIAIFVLFILFLAGFLLNPRNTEQITAGTAEETTNIADLVKSPTTDFALVLDWTETGDFLQLGEQTGTYPFETPLPQDAKMVVTKEDNGAELHTVDCLDEAGIRLTYSHLDGQPDTILKLETDYKELSTPRGIHVGSTKAEVVGAYGTDLVYCVKEDGSNLLAAHNYFYAYQPKDAYSNSICFFMEDGLVAGIRVENMLDAGNEAYSVNNITRFPIQSSGDPDYSNRQDIYQEPIDTTRRVYIAWNQLVTNETSLPRNNMPIVEMSLPTCRIWIGRSSGNWAVRSIILPHRRPSCHGWRARRAILTPKYFAFNGAVPRRDWMEPIQKAMMKFSAAPFSMIQLLTQRCWPIRM